MDFLAFLQTAFGWIYFVAWSATFYPQVILIFKRRNASGFSTDHMIINNVGFISYTIFTVVSYYNESAKKSHIQHTGVSPQVELNDLVFALHGAIGCIVLTAQLLYFPPHQHPRRLNVIVCATVLLLVLLGLVYSLMFTTPENNNWFAYLRFTGFVKVAASLVKHFPQVVLNIARQSTVGFSFTMVCLDAVGGLFSLAQQGVRCLRLQSFAPFTANVAKTVLAIESLLFDFFFVVQHLIWYTDRRDFDDIQEKADDGLSKAV